MAYDSNTEHVVGGGWSGSLNGGAVKYGIPDSVIVTQDMGAIGALGLTSVVSGGAADATTANVVAVTFTPARCVTIDLSGAGTETVTITGTDCWGKAASEVIAFNGTTAVVGNVAFKTVTGWQMVTAATAGRTCDIGSSDKIGFWYPVGSIGDIVSIRKYATVAGGVVTGTADANVVKIGSTSANADDRGTITFITNIPDGTKAFSLHYKVARLDSVVSI